MVLLLLAAAAILALILLGLHVGPHGSIASAAIGMAIGVVATIFVSSSHIPAGLVIGFLAAVLAGTGTVVVLALRGLRVAAGATGANRQLTRVFDSEGTVITDIAPIGTVKIGGDLWSAESDGGQPIPAGAKVYVTRVEGLRLFVVPEVSTKNER